MITMVEIVVKLCLVKSKVLSHVLMAPVLLLKRNVQNAQQELLLIVQVMVTVDMKHG
jgi:hypothetical protein